MHAMTWSKYAIINSTKSPYNTLNIKVLISQIFSRSNKINKIYLSVRATQTFTYKNFKQQLKYQELYT